MLSFTLNSSINELLPYLLGVLGLLMTWELHDLEVRAGRIKGLDISDPAAIRRWLRSYSGMHLYIHATPNDHDACDACRKADHTYSVGIDAPLRSIFHDHIVCGFSIL